MRKLLAGCLVVVLIGIVALGVALYFGYRAVSPMIDNATTMVQQARDAAAQSRRVENQADYTPPADGTLSEAQVERYLAVHARTRAALGSRWEELRSQAAQVQEKANQDARELSFSEIAGVLRSLGSIIVDARRAHVDAMNAGEFSEAEYRWVAVRMYEAAGLEIAEGIDWSQIEEVVRQGSDRAGFPAPSVPRADVPARNRELVKPHLGELQAWLPLTVLGF